MSKKIVYISTICLLVQTEFFCSVQAQPKQRVAVVAPLHTSNENQLLGETVSEILTIALSDQKNMVVVDRTSLEKVLREQKLGLSGLVNPETAARVGKLLTADVVVAGSVVEVNKTLRYSVIAVAVDSRKILGSVQRNANREQFDEVVWQIAKKIADAAGADVPTVRPDEIDDSPIGRLHLMRGISLYYANNPNEAITYCLRAVRLDPRLQESRLWIARCYWRLNDAQHARVELNWLTRNCNDRELLLRVQQLTKKIQLAEKQ